MKEAIATENNRCPDCGGKLNALIGVFGRQVCRNCKHTVITNREDDKFDDHTWGYIGDDQHKNCIYQRLPRRPLP